jgi:hypothetical protein
MLTFTETIFELISSNRLQYLIYTSVSLVVLGFVGILYLTNKLLFQRFLGDINPIMAFLLIVILGFSLFTFLIHQNWFAIYKEGNLVGLLSASGLAAVFGVIVIFLDIKIVFPADTNILFPESVLFYPAIGFFAEILFHVLPLTLLLFLLNIILKIPIHPTIIWICILIVALLEPVYQSVNMASTGQHPMWAVLVIGLHIFLLNIFQLIIFKRYDFVSMYTFRLVYYLFWHIGWGFVRLRLLF